MPLPMPRAILFDLDGTLADTAPDLAAALNRLRRDRGLSSTPYEQLRPHTSAGARGMIGAAFGLKPGGQVFFSTLNRNLKAYLQAVLAAEYLLRMLPKGTHDYAKFITPAELAQFVRNAGLTVDVMRGMSYNPLTQIYSLNQDTSVNYLMACTRPA